MEFCQKNEICGFLTNLRKHTNLSFSILFTYDGFVITNDQKERDNERDLQSLGAISAGILSLAQKFAKSFKRNTIDSYISIQAGKKTEKDSFTLLIYSVNRDINLLIGFPASLNLGVLKFEIKQTIKRISDYFENLKNNKNLTSNEILFEN